MSFEESLICHAAPTLAGLKIANLYSFKFSSDEECKMTIHHFNLLVNPKGIYIEILKNTGDFFLIYVYRKSHLQKKLQDSEVQMLMAEYGYPVRCNIEKYLSILKMRLKTNEDFPHEIGVLLGYPLADVKAFIETKGQNCIACGDWKVYSDEESAKCLFCKYKHCREVYMSVYGAGRKFVDMLVGA